MAKIKPYTHVLGDPFVICLPQGADLASDPYAWHLVHEYTWDYQWLFAYGFPLPAFPDIALCKQAALDYVSLPCMLRDMCPFCIGATIYFRPCPSIPRWNIYRGQNHQLTPPAIYWDVFATDPPPGFEWWHW